MAQTEFITAASGGAKPYTPVFVDTIADLRALTEPWPVVHVSGHTTVEDGGGGEFRYAGIGATFGPIGSGGADDDGWHIVNTGGMVWARVSDVVTPQMFGAFPSLTTTAARTATDKSARVQRALDFYLYPSPTVFPGLVYSTATKLSRRFELPDGLYRCESTINLDFSTYGDEATHGYDYSMYYAPGDLMMHGCIWTPYLTDITAISLRSHLIMGRAKIQLNCHKDVLYSLPADPPTTKKKWDTVTYPTVYFDDECVRTWTNGVKYYRDETIKYVSSSITYLLRCTRTGTADTATPTLTGAEFGSTGKFYCLGTSRLANGKNMDDMFMDTPDVGIHVAVLVNADNVRLSAANYCVGVRIQPREQAGVSWSKIDIPRAPGCKAAVMLASYRGNRITELGGRLALQSFPIGGMAWETAYPKSDATYISGKTWSSGLTGVVVNDLIRYSLTHPVGVTQNWAWRVTIAGAGTLGTTPPAPANCTTTPWPSGDVTMVCIGSQNGTRYVYNGGGESTPGNWAEAGSAYQNTIDLGWVNDNQLTARYLIPFWQETGSNDPPQTISATQSLYGIVMTGPYSNNNNHFDMVDMTPANFGTTWTLKEAAEVLLYSGSQNTFHVRQENSNVAAAMLAQCRRPNDKPVLNVVRSARNPALTYVTTANRHRGGGGGNILLGPLYRETETTRYDVDFSGQLTFSGYATINSQSIAFSVLGSAATLEFTGTVTAGLTSETTKPRYFAADDSWQFDEDYCPCVVVDLGQNYTGSYLIRITPKLGDPLYTSDRWVRWMAHCLEEDGVTKLDPGMIADTTMGPGTYSSIPLITEIGNGVSHFRPQQSATGKYLWDLGKTYDSKQILLAVHPLVKRVAIGLRGSHYRGFIVEVIGSQGTRIYSPIFEGKTGTYTDVKFPVISAVPEKGILMSPATLRYMNGAAVTLFASLNFAAGQMYYCTSGATPSPGTNRMWRHTGAVQGSAVIEEFNGSTWDTIATGAYFTEPTVPTYFQDLAIP